MKAYPHQYQVAAAASPEGDVLLSSAGLESLRTAPPVEFDGPGDRWSPETLLVGAIGNCFILTFRAVARAARIPWLALDCDVAVTLERHEGVSRFTGYTLNARLQVPVGSDIEMAERALHKAKAGCLISNSLTGSVKLIVRIEAVA